MHSFSHCWNINLFLVFFCWSQHNAVCVLLELPYAQELGLPTPISLAMEIKYTCVSGVLLPILPKFDCPVRP